MAYATIPCERCGCVPVLAQTSGPDAKWRTCECICHDTAKVFERIGPLPKEQ